MSFIGFLAMISYQVVTATSAYAATYRKTRIVFVLEGRRPVRIKVALTWCNERSQQLVFVRMSRASSDLVASPLP
jgi:hypothetical protein